MFPTRLLIFLQLFINLCILQAADDALPPKVIALSSSENDKLFASNNKKTIHKVAADKVDWNIDIKGLTKQLAPTGNWIASCIAGDSSVAYAAMYKGKLFSYHLHNQTWIALSAPEAAWYDISTSLNGVVIYAVIHGGRIYMSHNGGGQWKAAITPPLKWTAVVTLDSGKDAVVASFDGAIYMTSNSGLSWKHIQSSPVAEKWHSLGIFNNYLIAAAYDGGII